MNPPAASDRMPEPPDDVDARAAFDRQVEEAGPSSLLVVISDRMGALLRRRMTPADVWQEALLNAWRDRDRFQSQGPGSFRRWLLQIIDHRIHDLIDHEGAAKRGAGTDAVSVSREASDAGSSRKLPAPFLTSTTPSRIASAREEAELMQTALKELPSDLQEVVRLRLFEDLEMSEIATRLGLGVEGVRHRFRKGAEIYHGRLRELLASRRSGDAAAGR